MAKAPESSAPAVEILTPGTQPVAWVTPTRAMWAAFICFCAALGTSYMWVNPLFVAAGLTALLGLIFVFCYPILGVLAYIGFEYTRLALLFPFLQAVQPGKVIVIITFVAWVLQGLRTRSFHMLWDRVGLVWVLWLLLALVSIPGSLSPKYAWAGVLDLARFVAVYLLLVNVIDSWRKWNVVVWLLLILNFKLSQFQIRSYMHGVGFTDNRESFINQGVGVGVHGFFSNSNDFGVAMCVILPLAVYMMLATKNKLLKLAAGLMGGAFLASILYTSSRGAALGLAVMGLVYWIMSRQKFLMGVAVALLLVGYWIVAPPELESRFHSGMDYEQDRSATQRLEAWKGGLRMMAAHPLTGVGMSNFRANIEVDPRANLAARYSHSNWIQAGSELGVFAIFLFLWVLWIAFQRNRETRALLAGRNGRAEQMKLFTYALDISMVGFIVTGTFTAMLYYPFMYVNLALIVALHAIALKETAAQSQAADPIPKLSSPREAALVT